MSQKTPAKTCEDCGVVETENSSHFKTNKAAPVCDACKVKRDKAKLRAQMQKRKAEKEEAAARKQAAKERKAAEKQQHQLEVAARRRQRQQDNAIAKAAQKELVSRELSKRSLLDYILRFDDSYIPGWVHEDICKRLERFVTQVEAGKSPRLMLWVPPRHGKSRIASQEFPSWVLGKHPEWEFIMTSYSQDLPLKFSRKIRDRVRDPSYHKVFPFTALSKDSTSAEAWLTTQGGGLRAAGVGGGITGMGAHIFVIDDPVKDRDEADSETIREKAWDWYGSTAYTRLAPGGGLLVIQTRWHDDDLSGRLERQMLEFRKEIDELSVEIEALYAQGKEDEAKSLYRHKHELLATMDHWEIVKYPALAEDDEYIHTKTGRVYTPNTVSKPEELFGTYYKRLRTKDQALHPKRFDETMLKRIKRTLPARDWSALYQQNPVPDEGLIFKKDQFRYEDLPYSLEGMHLYAAFDLAGGEKQQNDFTVGVLAAVDWNDDLRILDFVRGKWSDQNVVADIIMRWHKKYEDHGGLSLVGIEKGQLELTLMPILNRKMKAQRVYVPIAEGDEALKPITDKVARARPLQARMQQGNVIFPFEHSHPWVETVRQEMLRFPGGRHDDCVDAMAWLTRMVLKRPVPRPLTMQKPKFKSWKERLRDHMGTQGGYKSWMSR